MGVGGASGAQAVGHADPTITTKELDRIWCQGANRENSQKVMGHG